MTCQLGNCCNAQLQLQLARGGGRRSAGKQAVEGRWVWKGNARCHTTRLQLPTRHVAACIPPRPSSPCAPWNRISSRRKKRRWMSGVRLRGPRPFFAVVARGHSSSAVATTTFPSLELASVDVCMRWHLAPASADEGGSETHSAGSEVLAPALSSSHVRSAPPRLLARPQRPAAS